MNRSTVTDATVRLAAAGIASPRVDAELLAAHVLGVDRGRLLLAEEMTADQRAEFTELVGRRATRQPLQHIIGTASLGPVDVEVGPGVFVPRPETERLLEWVLETARTVERPRIVDLCSGSGAIAIAVATMVPAARVIAVENDPGALIWLRHNVARLAQDVSGRVTIVDGDARDPDLLRSDSADIVVSNPPYVPDGAPVEIEVAEHDPAIAVFGGHDGMSVIDPMIGLVANVVRAGGRCAIEHDDTTAELVVAALRRVGAFDRVDEHTDLAGRPRFVSARRVLKSAPPGVRG